MKFLLLTASLFAISHGAIAQTSECSTVPKASDRLACYDRANPPTSAKPGTSKKKAVSGTSPDQGAAVDALAVENSKLDAKLKTICRGC
jgi:hypothetical protein